MIRLPRRNPEINANYSPRRRLTAGGLRLDFSSQQRALGELNRAVGQGPRYVEEDVSSGVKAVAKGAQQVTGALQELQLRNQDITDKRKLYDAETQLAVMGEELQGKLTQENDPNKWESLAAEHMASAQFDTEGMSPSAVEALQQYAERTKALTVARARNGGFAENERKYLESANARLQIAEDSRDLKGVVRIAQEIGDTLKQPAEVVLANITPRARNIQSAELRDLSTQIENLKQQGKHAEAKELAQNHHYLNDSLLVHEKERVIMEIDADMEEKEFDSAIASNPTAELEELDKPDGKYSKYPAYKKQEMKFKATQMRDNKSMLASKRVTDRMAEGTIINPNQLDQPEFKDLTPTMKNTLKESIVGGPPNNRKEWMSVMLDLNGWKPSADSYQDDIDLNHLENTVGVRFTGAFKDQLMKRIAEIRSGPDASKTSAAKQHSAQLFKNGGFGTIKVPYTPRREAGWFTTEEEGTALSPADQMRLGDEVAEKDRIKPKELVVDVRKQAAAQAKLMEINEGIDRMAAAGESEQKQIEWVNDQAAQYSIAPALENKEKAITPVQQQPMFNSLPGVNNYMSRFSDTSVNEGAALPDGRSPALNTPNPLLPPPTK